MSGRAVRGRVRRSAAAVVAFVAALQVLPLLSPPAPAAASFPGGDISLGIEPGAAMAINRAATRADEMAKQARANGATTVVAVIDTGVDPSHPDLQTCPGGAKKIVQWMDFSGEGTVGTSSTGRLAGGRLGTPWGVVRAAAVTSAGGTVHYGRWRESQVESGGPLGQDVDGDGAADGAFLVVVADTVTAGVFDTVYVDCDRDLDLADEQPLRPFSVAGQWGRLRGPPRSGATMGAAFVVADIAANGAQVILGFDGNGHGTHVAGVIAARAGSPGGVAGLAPGAQLMSLKALGSSGRGGWNRVAEAMAWAAEHGARVVCISVAGLDVPGAAPPSGAAGTELVSRLMGQLNRKYGCLFVIAAGNNGPALGSVATPGDPVAALSCGAYLSPRMWSYAYGYDVPGDELWYYSAVGPRYDGSGAPDLLAPGVGVSCVPVRYVGGGYQLFEGTSVAAAHVAGAAALLFDAARRASLTASAAWVREALCVAARGLPGCSAAEQGAGVVDVAAAWTWLATALRAGRGAPGADLRFSLEGRKGMFDRGAVPGSEVVDAANAAPEPVRARIRSNAGWLGAGYQSLALPGRGERQLPLRCQPLTRPGLYCGSLSGVGADGRRLGPPFHVTVVVPRRLEPGKGTTLEGRLAPAEYHREYLAVSEGASLLQVAIAVPRGADGRPAGRVRLHLFDPQGGEALFAPFLGLPADECSSRVSFTIVRPAAGVWEAVVYSSAALRSYAASESRYTATFRVEGASVAAGVEATGAGPDVPLTLDVETGPMVGEVLAVARDGQADIPARVTLAPSGESMQPVPLVPPGTALLRVAAGNPSDGAADLDLFLYRLDTFTGRWVEVGRGAQAGVSSESVELVSPPSGRYSAKVRVAGGLAAASTLTFEYEARAYARTGYRLLGGDRRQVMPGLRWPLRLVPPATAAGSRYLALLLRDVHAQTTVAVVPLRLDAGLPALAVTVMPPLLSGQKQLRLQVREADGGRPVDVVAGVGGQRFHVIGGQAVVPAALAAGGALRVTIDDPRYRFFDWSFTVLTGAGAIPAGGAGPSGETLRLKLLDEITGGT